MAAFAPFEPQPVLGLAVSGGPDSMALALLADRWAKARGGRVEAVTVDHGLRPDSAAEARQVGRWLKARFIRHRILRWEGAKPASDLAAEARDARYRLLVDGMAARGILHLLLAHHRDDQAETLLLRLGRGSGVDGLSAMASVVELGPLRLLRPLLDVPKAALVASLRTAGQAWAEDPSNRAGESARSRVRLALEQDGLSPRRLAETAQRLGRARQALEQATTDLLARAVAIHPQGYLRLDAAALADAPEELRLRALARCLTTVAGEPYPPRLERLERLDRALIHKGGGRGHTLHGCRVIRDGGRWLICRELAAVADPVALVPGRDLRWDRRFLVRASVLNHLGQGLRIGALGEEGWRLWTRAWARAQEESGATVNPQGIPRAAALALPGFYGRNGLVGVAFLGLLCRQRDGRQGAQADRIINQSAVFLPLAPLAPLGFAVAPAMARTI